jgi:hypothetical protein
VVESTALEMRHTRKGIGGSNPSLSAKRFNSENRQVLFGCAARRRSAPTALCAVLFGTRDNRKSAAQDTRRPSAATGPSGRARAARPKNLLAAVRLYIPAT